MALNIKNQEVERLVTEIALVTGESKTEAVRRALAERRARLAQSTVRRERGAPFLRFLDEEVWPKIPKGVLLYGPPGTGKS